MPRASSVASPESPTVVINQGVQPREASAEQPKRERIEFWPYIASLSPADWRRHEVYLYRTKPIVGQKQREKYLDIYNQKFTIEDIKTRFGGEEFRAMLLRDGKNILTEEFAVEAAPKYDLAREIPGVDTAQSATIEKLVDRLTENNDNGTGQAVERSISIMGDAFDAAAKRLASSPNSGNGNLLETIKTLKELELIGQPQKNSVLETIQVLKELGIIGTQTQMGSQIGVFKEMLGVIKEFAGEVGGGKTDWKAELVNKGLDKIPEVMRGISAMGERQIQLERERRARIEAAGRAAAIARGESPSVNPTPSTESNTPAVNGALRIVSAPEDAASTRGTDLPVIPMQEIFYRRIVEMVGEGEPGGVIMDFLYGADRSAYSFMLGMNEAQIKEMLGQHPTLSKILAYPQLDELLAQIVEYSREVKDELSGDLRETSPAVH